MSKVDQIWNEGMIKSLRDSLDAVTAERDVLKTEVEKLKAKTTISLGVGDGSGQLFVNGDYDSIKACQAKLLELEKLRIETDALKARIDKGVRVLVTQSHNCYFGDDTHWGNKHNATLILDEGV